MKSKFVIIGLLLLVILPVGGVLVAADTMQKNHKEALAATTEAVIDTPTPEITEPVIQKNETKTSKTTSLSTPTPTTRPTTTQGSTSNVTNNTVNNTSTNPVATQIPTAIPTSIPTAQPATLTLCFTPESQTINFNEEITFNASCTETSNNTATKAYWEFRDDLVTKEGNQVTHKFTKFSKNFESALCSNSFSKGFEVKFCFNGTKSGCLVRHYCPSADDPVVQNIKNCIKNSNGTKNRDQCIQELGL